VSSNENAALFIGKGDKNIALDGKWRVKPRLELLAYPIKRLKITPIICTTFGLFLRWQCRIAGFKCHITNAVIIKIA